MTVTYTPIFVGKTEDDEKIVLYENLSTNKLHIRRPDGVLCAIEMPSSVELDYGVDDIIRLRVSCEAWTGEATGTRRDLIAQEPIRL